MAQNLLALSAGGVVTEISTAYAPLASPTFTGTVTLPGGGKWVTSGSVGLNNTPSIWTYGTAIEVGLGNALWGVGNGDVLLLQGAYYDGGFKRANSGGDAVSQYEQFRGDHIWRYAAGGAIGSAITWTEVMRVSTAGLLSAPSVKVTSAAGYISSDNSTGITTTVTTASLVGKTLTIKDGIITGFA